MPQMAPLNWMMVTPFCLALLIISIILIFFNLNLMKTNKKMIYFKKFPSMKW